MPNDQTSEQILAQLAMFGIRPGLRHSRPLLAALGNPQAGLPTVLVAGTNGKGSTAALIAAIASAAGYRCGLYTSPHLEQVSERLRIDGRLIEDPHLADLLREVLDHSSAIDPRRPPTYFEALTLAALLYFQRRQVDLAVLEVGLGGRLDTTNLSEPQISVISSIALDHRESLGATLAQVASEKAGILRAGRPALVWAPQAEVAAVLKQRAEELGSELVRVDQEVRIESEGAPASLAQRATLHTSRATYPLVLNLLGRHQLNNLALAVATGERLAESGFSALGPTAIDTGSHDCRWPGRLEWVDLPGGPRVLLDGAHNPAASKVLASYLDTLKQPIDLLFGALADKEIERMLPPLAKRCRKLWLTEPTSHSRGGGMALAAKLLGDRAQGLEPRVADALWQALEGCADRLLICGSLYLIGEVRGLLRQRFGVPPRVGQAASTQVRSA